jgi:hypothetical protein
MDSNTILTRTSKGEDEIRSKTAHLSGDIKRSLLMVDGIATFGEISKRAAPSLRNSLEQMFKELMQDGFIQEKAGPGKIFRKGAPSGMVPKMVVPSRKASAPKMSEDDEGDNDLDFASEFRAHPQEELPDEADNAVTDAETEAKAHALAQAKVKQKDEAQSRAEADAQARSKAKARARQEAEVKTRNVTEGESTDSIEVQARALQEAREIAEAKARQKSGSHILTIDEENARQETDEIARLEAEAKAKRDAEAKARAAIIAQERALEAAKARVEAEAKARLEAEAKARAEAEARAEAKARREAEARARAEAEAKVRREAEARARAEAEAKIRREAEARARAEAEAKARREAEARERAETEAETDIESNLGQELEVGLEPFNFNLSETTGFPVPTVEHTGLGMQKSDVALMNDIGKFVQPEEAKKSHADKETSRNPEQADEPSSDHIPNKTLPNETAKSDSEPRKPSVYELKMLEEAQAKVWAEAEQRAKEESKTKFVWDADLPPEPQPAVKKLAPVARVKRKPLPWFKLIAGFVALVMIILFVAPFLIPTKEYIPGIEKLLSGKFKQPVYIEHIKGRLLPTPRLDLIDMAIGNNKQIKIKLVRLDFAIPALFTVVKSIDSLELEAVEVDAAALEQTSELLQQAAADIDFPISRIILINGKLETEGLALSRVGGEINFNQAGKFTLAKFNAEGNKYELALESAPLYKTRATISIHGSGLPLFPNWVFDSLTAKGEITGKELIISEMEGHILGGTLQGNVRLGWRSGWLAQGSLVAKAISMQNMFKVLSGDMDGTARFQMQADSMAKLADVAKLDGSFVIKNGVINGIDIAETARLHRKENMPGGRTHFDELSGDLSYDKGAYAFRNLKLVAGVLAAKGTLDYSGKQVAGSIAAELDLHQGIGPVPLVLGGTHENPTLITR